MDANVGSDDKFEAHPVEVGDVARQAMLDLLRRYDRVLIALSVVAGAGLLVQMVIEAGAHPILVLTASGVIGCAVMLSCISIVWGQGRFMRPWSAMVAPIVVMSVLSGVTFGAVTGVLWLVIPGDLPPLAGLLMREEWVAWHYVASGAVFAMVLSDALVFAWPLTSTTRLRFGEALVLVEEFRAIDDQYDGKTFTVHSSVLLVVAMTAPVICLLAPVWYALYIGHLFMRVWARREA